MRKSKHSGRPLATAACSGRKPVRVHACFGSLRLMRSASAGSDMMMWIGAISPNDAQYPSSVPE